MENEYTYFWKNRSPFSNWHPSEFEVDGRKFTNMEQYMMWAKAVLMADFITADKIMQATHPKECKALGRKVKPFKADLWEKHKEELVYVGCHAKFSQNEEMKESLLKSKGTLVEASPYDKVWGIGLNEGEAKKIHPSEWPGQNLLGKILTKVRIDME